MGIWWVYAPCSIVDVYGRFGNVWRKKKDFNLRSNGQIKGFIFMARSGMWIRPTVNKRIIQKQLCGEPWVSWHLLDASHVRINKCRRSPVNWSAFSCTLCNPVFAFSTWDTAKTLATYVPWECLLQTWSRVRFQEHEDVKETGYQEVYRSSLRHTLAQDWTKNSWQ